MDYAGVIVEDRFGHEIISCAPTSMGGVTATFVDENDGLANVFKQILKVYPSLKELAAEAYCHSVIVDTPMFYRYTAQGMHRSMDIDYKVRVYDWKGKKTILSFVMADGKLYDLISDTMVNTWPERHDVLEWIKSIVCAGIVFAKAFAVFEGKA